MPNGVLHNLFPNLTTGNILYFLGWILFIWLLLFIIFREVKCWYYKINDMIYLLVSIDKRLEQLNNNLYIFNSKANSQHIEMEYQSSTTEMNTASEAAAASEEIKEEFSSNVSEKKDFNNINKFKEFLTKERHISEIFSKKEDNN